MRAFVTGGTGFVGAHLVQALLRRGDDVTCLVRSPAKAQSLGWRNVRIVRGDLDNKDALRQGCADADVVYHVAGKISAKGLDDFMSANRDGTAHVLEAAGGRLGRFVFVSSLAVAGPTQPGRPIDETRVPQPVTDYGRSKLAAELLVRQGPCPWTIVRPAVVYGEWDREVFKLFKAAKLGVAPVFGDGSQEVSVIYAGDLAAALIAAGTAPDTAGRTYFAAHPTSTTSRGLILAIAAAMDRKVRIMKVPKAVGRASLWAIGSLAHLAGIATLLTADKANESLAPAWVCSPAALERDSGWKATMGLEAGLKQTVEWYREKNWL